MKNISKFSQFLGGYMKIFRSKFQILAISVLILSSMVLNACQAAPTAVPATLQSSDEAIATMVAGTLTAFPSPTSAPTATLIPSETPTETHPSSFVYTNDAYGFAFEYPRGWEVTETLVPKGTSLRQRSFSRYDVNADDSDVLVVDITKGSDWILEIIPKKSPQACGGMGSVPYDASYQPLEILGRTAARLRPEDGYAWNPPEGNEFAALPVMFIKLTGECTQTWSDKFIPAGEVVFLWEVSDSQKPLSINITYYSSQFTDTNLQNRTIDYDVIWEMDTIVQSLRLLPGK